jgi:4-hydroxy-tetrahydrodipicolinate reductase
MTDAPGLVVTGASGRMGRTLLRLIAEPGSGARLAGAVVRPGHPWIGRDAGEAVGGAPLGVAVTDDPLEAFARAQGVIDFTAPAATVEFAALAAQARAVHVIGTTGLEAGHLQGISAAARHAVVVRAGTRALASTACGAHPQGGAGPGRDWDVEIVRGPPSDEGRRTSGTA